MKYKWNILSKSTTLQEVLTNILSWKKIPKENIRKFINFDFEPYDPYLLTNMDKAVKRINDAKNNNEKIIIVGDYDADGVCSTSVLYIGLRSLFYNVTWIIPDRVIDGYGINKRIIDEAKNRKCDLIITVDNGINSKEQINYAQSLGIDVIVTDHHQLNGELPCEITINPHISDNYPFKSLCGCMVAFKLIKALIPNLKKNTELYEELVGITSIGTVADVMELIDENRYYVKHGLQYLSKTGNVGLRVLLNKLNLDNKELSSSDIGFMIGPCINAAGRLSSADIAVKLLLCDDIIEAEKYADKLISLNEERKRLQSEIVSSIDVTEDDKFAVIKLNNVSHGILGIIAGMVAEKYQKPCFVLVGKKEKNILSGSGRSVYGYDINSLIQDNNDIATGGGHAAACGVSINYNDFDEFKNRCNSHFNNWLQNADIKDITPVLNISSEIPLELIDKRLISNIDKLQPYGNGNEEPIFVSKNIFINSHKVVGKNKNVIQFSLSQDNTTVKSVGFNAVKEKFIKLNNPQNVNIVYSLSLNEWPRGTFTPQLIIKDIEAC